MKCRGVRFPIAGADKSKMKIKMLFCSKSFRARCFKGQGNGRGNTLTERTVLAGKDKLTSTTLLSDQRGAVAFELPIVLLFLMSLLLLPLANVAVAGFQFLSAREALRAFGQSIQYNPPPDVTNTGDWKSRLPTTVASYPINDLQVVCGNAPCSPGNSVLPKYYSYTTTVTLSPFNFLKPVLCRSSNADPCSFTLPYSEQFQ
jgi:hypothetical protein